MNQQGYVIEIVDNKTAKLKVQRHSACASCGKCTTTSEKKDVLINADNSIGAKIGDHVEINMDNIKVLKATSIAYLLPLAGLFIGTVVSYFVLQNNDVLLNLEFISGIVGIIFMIITFCFIKNKDKKFKDSKNFVPIITKILI